jgi:hypothetical protein
MIVSMTICQELCNYYNNGGICMVLIKLYEYGDGAVISKYCSPIAPYQNERIYLGEKVGIVKEVAHIIAPALSPEETDSLHWIEVGIEFI